MTSLIVSVEWMQQLDATVIEWHDVTDGFSIMDATVIDWHDVTDRFSSVDSPVIEYLMSLINSVSRIL